jgi:hypothetical protein
MVKLSFLETLILEVGADNPETSTSNHCTPRNKPGDGRLQFNCGGSLRSCFPALHSAEDQTIHNSNTAVCFVQVWDVVSVIVERTNFNIWKQSAEENRERMELTRSLK